MAKAITPRERPVPIRRVALILPILALGPIGASAVKAAHSVVEPGTALLREIDGTLYFSETGDAWRPVPEGPTVATLRDLLSREGKNGSLRLEVGRTVVADGASGWHGGEKKRR